MARDMQRREREQQVLEAIFEIGLKAASPKVLLGLMPEHPEVYRLTYTADSAFMCWGGMILHKLTNTCVACS